MPMAVAQRYASALAEIAGPQGDYERVAQDLANFAAAYRESAELREVFDSPAVLPKQKENILAAILDRLEASDLAKRFLRVLLAHYRVNVLDKVRSAF
ncbi:MAG TPA: F0F1 ATP synthase subunit delta, partial [Terriglobia bacterium]|nr:F0F1 ATP synthase subunit delta [Terriglobia bacterium]